MRGSKHGQPLGRKPKPPGATGAPFAAGGHKDKPTGHWAVVSGGVGTVGNVCGGSVGKVCCVGNVGNVGRVVGAVTTVGNVNRVGVPVENTNPVVAVVPVVVGAVGKVAPGGSVMYGNEVGRVFFTLKQNPLQFLVGTINKIAETNNFMQSLYIADTILHLVVNVTNMKTMQIYLICSV